MSSAPREFGTGALSEVTAAIYWYLVLGILFVLVTAPGTVPALFLERHISNAPLYALFLTPLAPALSAVLFALEQRQEAEAVTPARYFFRGYRLNALDSLKVWAPAAVVVVMLAINLGNVEATGFGPWYSTVAILLGLVTLVWLLLAIVIVSLFSFRGRDVARLSVAYLFGRPLVSLGLSGVVVICVIIALLTFDAVVVLLGSLIAAAILRVSRPVQADIRAQFLAPGGEQAR